jgi:hypothetical protein
MLTWKLTDSGDLKFKVQDSKFKIPSLKLFVSGEKFW